MKIGDTIRPEQRRQLDALASDRPDYTWDDPKVLEKALRIALRLDGPFTRTFTNATRARAVDILAMTDQGRAMLDHDDNVADYMELDEPSRRGEDALVRFVEAKDTLAAMLGRPKVYAVDWALAVVHSFVAAGSLEMDVKTSERRIPLDMHADARLVHDYAEWMLDRMEEESGGHFVVKVGDRPRRAWAIERLRESATAKQQGSTVTADELFEQVFQAEIGTRRTQGLPPISLADLRSKMRKDGLSQSRRRMIVALGVRKMAVTEIAGQMGCTKSYVSSELKKAGVTVG